MAITLGSQTVAAPKFRVRAAHVAIVSLALAAAALVAERSGRTAHPFSAPLFEIKVSARDACNVLHARMVRVTGDANTPAFTDCPGRTTMVWHDPMTRTFVVRDQYANPEGSGAPAVLRHLGRAEYVVRANGALVWTSTSVTRILAEGDEAE